MDMKGIYYNYDLEECNWMFKQGVYGMHDKAGNTFIVFMLIKQCRQLEKKYRKNNK